MQSLRSQLIASFVLVIVVSIGLTYFFVNRGIGNEIQDFEQHDQQIELTRMESLLSRYYADEGEWSGVHLLVENMGALYGKRIVLADENEIVVADSEGELAGEDFLLDEAGASMGRTAGKCRCHCTCLRTIAPCFSSRRGSDNGGQASGKRRFFPADWSENKG